MRIISRTAYITCQHAMTIIKYVCDKNEISMSIYSELKYSTQMKEIFPVYAIKTEYGGEWSTSRPGCCIRQRHAISTEEELDGPQSRSDRFRTEINVFLLPKFEHETFHPITSPYNDYAIPAPKMF